MKYLLLTLIALLVPPALAQEEGRDRPEPDFEAAVETLTEALSLTEEQQGQVKQAMADYCANLDTTMAKHEAAEEPDPQKMIGDVKKVRAAYHDDLGKVLSKEQFEGYEKLVDQVQREMMSDLAEIRLMDMQEPLALTDEQIEKLAPMMGDSLLKTLRILIENADKRLGPPAKIKLAKSLKKIQSDLQSGFKKVLSDEQVKAWQTYKEEQQDKAG